MLMNTTALLTGVIHIVLKYCYDNYELNEYWIEKDQE